MNFAPEIPALAAYLENQLFKDALSENDYMDREKLLIRVQNLINLRWTSAQHEPMHATTSLPTYVSAPTLGMKSNLINKPLCDQYTIADTGCMLDRAPKLLADVPRSSIYGSQKCMLEANLWQPELVPPNNHFSGMGFSNAESGDSGITYSGLQYDSEASFESHRYKYQDSTKGEANFDIFNDMNSPSVHTSAMARENLKFEVSSVSDGLYMRQPVLGSLQLKQQLSCLESHSDGRFGENESLGSLPVQNRNLYALPGTTSTSSNTQQLPAVLLVNYIIYNLSRGRLKVPLLEFLHSRNCEGGICKCEEHKWFLSHYDDCGSANCNICGPAVKECSARGINIVQPGLRKQRIGVDRLTHSNDCGKRVCVNTSEDLMNPAKSRKLDSSPRSDSPCDVSVLTEEPFSPSGPLNFAQPSVSQMMATIANPGANVEITTSHTNDALRISEVDNSHLDDVLGSGDATLPSEGVSAVVQQKDERVSSHIYDAARLSQEGNGTLKDTWRSNSDDVTKFSDDPSADDFCQKKIEPAVNELKVEVPDSRCELPSDYVPTFCDDKSIAPNVDFTPGRDPEEIQPRINQEGFPPIPGSWTGMKSEKQKVDGISLIDFFTPEEIKQHISGLRQKDDQGIIKELVGNGASCSVSENFCQLCALPQLAFSPMPLYCSSCAGRIKKNATYYSTNDKTCDPFFFCTTCYNKCHREFTFYGLSFSKPNLETLKNDSLTVESWVQCDRCEGWQHQICALFNDKKDLGGKSEYLCPRCYLEDLEFGVHMSLPRSSSLDASNLPQTLLSDHLEQRLFESLKEERKNRAKAAGKNPEEVPHPADLAVRVVSSVNKRVKVKQQFLDIFPEKSYPAEFPYRSKVILLFQRIEGVDVCLFAMYVQEFGSSCSQPNQRCVYISYLDSVKYFRPDTKTVKGEALRTFVYHEILVGYLDYCKKRGFVTCYIWACPPVKGEDYILYCHPETQKTPRPDKLRQWYQSMLKKATEEKIVVNFSNLYEKFIAPTEEYNTKVTAARLPYFDGDYWSTVVEGMIKKIDKKSRGNPQEQLKGFTKRRLKAMGHTNPSADDAKDILLMQELEQSISSAKEDFIIVYLQFVCTHCHEIISGIRWFCNQCKNFQLCGRCHDVAKQSGPADTHMSSAGQRHALSQEVVNDVPVDTEDNDAIMDNCFLENRHALLSFCQGNHYQFDSLRRAKHSSMMILYHLHHPNGSNAGTSCGLCLKDIISADPRWMCEICPEFNVCSSCYEKRGAFCHNHTLMHHPSTAIRKTEVKMEELVKQLLDVLLHASRCQTTTNHPCSYPNCVILRRLFSHAHACSIRVAGGCRHCKKTWFILLMHSRKCKDSSCGIPRCMELKNHARRIELESASRCLPSVSVIN
ncbi:hypothetical protein SOVF_025270 isoform B [Spinacia oleracea]|nr:histone acetyltransferase HAC1-like isoform X2 [Spinacia oleracea]KNA23368.1 hypothetical protein SOVF_025270 isoform B [Spinacia oleracea]